MTQTLHKNVPRTKSTSRAATTKPPAGQIVAKAVRWAKQHAGEIRACYYEKRGPRHLILIVPRAGHFAPQLSAHSADLDMRMVRALPRINFQSLQVPPGHNFSRSTLIYGD